MHDDVQGVMQETLGRVAEIFGAERAVAAWEPREEPGLTLARSDGSGFESREVEDDASYRPLVAESLDQQIFLVDESGSVWTTEGPVPEKAPLHRAVAEGFELSHCIAIPILAEAVEGYVIVAKPAPEREEALSIGAVVAALMATAIDATMRCRRVRSEVAAEERLRVARDLHDGLLQSFTGVVLQLETAHELIENDPAEAQRLITRLQAAMMSDQRDLRAYVEALRPRRRQELTFDFAARLRDMCQRFEEQWGTRVNVDAGGVDPHLGAMLGQETYRIVQEAVTNAARHGGASRVDVSLRTIDDMLVLDVTDNGAGLPTRGRMTLQEMVAKGGVGPASLAERVAALNGQVIADSSDEGLRLEIALPLGWAGA